MKIIEKLSDYIEEEIHDAEKYAKCALAYKDDRPELARTFYALSQQELEHMQMLHNHVTAIIEEYRKKNGDPPAEMLSRYEWLHERHISSVVQIRVMHSMYLG